GSGRAAQTTIDLGCGHHAAGDGAARLSTRTHAGAADRFHLRHRFRRRHDSLYHHQGSQSGRSKRKCHGRDEFSYVRSYGRDRSCFRPIRRQGIRDGRSHRPFPVRSDLLDCLHSGCNWVECFAAGDRTCSASYIKRAAWGNMKPAILCINAVISVSFITPAFAQQILEAKTSTELVSETPDLKKPPVLGSTRPEDLPPLFPEFADWLKRERVRVYGWIEGGYTHSSAGDRLLANAPTPNRF